MKKVIDYIFEIKISFFFKDDDEDENKRDKKSRPARHTDANRRRNTESSTAKPRQLAQEYQKPVCRVSVSIDRSYSNRFCFC